MRRRRVRHRSSSALSEPRFELVPMLDCTFQLLIFALYCLMLTVHARLMPVKLPALTTGQPARDVKIAGVTVDRQGKFFLNQRPVSRAELEDGVEKLAEQRPQPAFYLAIDAQQGQVDRGPVLIELIEMFRKSKVEKLNIVGAPTSQKAAGGTSPEAENK